MTENKVVIKINYDKSNTTPPEAEPKMITEWHVGRITMALTILLIVTILLISFLTGSEHTENAGITKSLEERPRGPMKRQQLQGALSVPDTSVLGRSEAEKGEEAETVEKERNMQRNPVSEKTLVTKERHNERLNKIHQDPVILDKRVARVVLARGLNKKEPVGEITLPVVVNKRKAIGVFFFTEIDNMKGQVLFHHWYRDDKPVFKRRINILGNRWRATTSKLMTFSQKGHWVAKLIDADGNVLSEIHFDVI